MTDQRLIPEQLGWPDLPAAQQPSWPDLAARDSAVARLRGMPPLVFAGECDLLRGQLAEAARGRDPRGALSGADEALLAALHRQHLLG